MCIRDRAIYRKAAPEMGLAAADLPMGEAEFRATPVSYTHLDVYKRQGLDRAVHQRSPDAPALEGGVDRQRPQHQRLSLIHI